jgi:hypothetical protein
MQVRGLPIDVTFLPSPRAYRGKLFSGKIAKGREVHAGSFLRQRRIVLDAALRQRPAELRRILIHELFHFAWLRLGNPKRRSYEEMVGRELAARVPGELGWSAESVKVTLTRADRLDRTRLWRHYVCESFCDSAAWMFAGVRRHGEYTLPAPARRSRRLWFETAELTVRISV